MVFFDISVFETTAIIKIGKFTVFSSVSFCQIYRVSDEALITETMVWPNLFLMNVFFALKGSKLFIIINIGSLILYTVSDYLSLSVYYCWHGFDVHVNTDQNQNQNSLLVKRQNDNTSPGDWPRKISP